MSGLRHFATWALARKSPVRPGSQRGCCGWREQQVRPGGLDGPTDRLARLADEIVHDHDVAAAERRNEAALPFAGPSKTQGHRSGRDGGLRKDRGIRWPSEVRTCRQSPFGAQPRSGSGPVLSQTPPLAGTRFAWQLDRERKDLPRWADPAPMTRPAFAGAFSRRARVRRRQASFLRLNPQPCKGRHRVSQPTGTPRFADKA